MNEGVLDTSDYIRVTNNSGQDIKGMYEGNVYLFKNGQPLDVHIVVAQHIFDFGREDKLKCFHRMGWVDHINTYEQAMERLSKISFDEVPSPTLDISPSKRGRSKISKPTPLVNAGVDDGEEDSSSPSEALGTYGDL
jgi:hypothetical protein